MEVDTIVILVKATDGNVYQARVTDLQKSGVYQVLRSLSRSGKIEVFDTPMTDLQIIEGGSGTGAETLT